MHTANWEKRKKTFRELDRIALFQFEIFSSYLHPDAEAEKNLNKNVNIDRITESQKRIGEEIYFPSFEEYRRRKLLEEVFKACDSFGVEILLPEYSVRPETVEWMCGYLEEQEYTFSIWAGTFKIPVDYKFYGKYWTELKGQILSEELYWHSAPLPVIMNDQKGNEPGERNVQVITKKFKKYPAVALKEEINPVPAMSDLKESKSFCPVVDKVSNFKTIDIDSDARKDVTELICAETFAVSNISNYPSFLQASIDADYKYRKRKSEDYRISYKTYKKKMLEDIMNFGRSTAMFSSNVEESRKRRSSIILIPACSTRTVDYYVIGQGNYLASGLKTVFCNSVDKYARGGSCFIGQNSWDDVRQRRGESMEEKDIFAELSENTYYHGLHPGIYQQASPYKDRGALGSKEQALLICDICANEKTNPTAESSMSSLSIVAHIPILEQKMTRKDCQAPENMSACRSCHYEKTQKSLKKLFSICQKGYTNTSFDTNPEWGQRCLRTLGELYHSDWLKERGDSYLKFHKLKPQMWPAPALIDWIYIEINYNEFKEEIEKGKSEERLLQEMYYIQVPSKACSVSESKGKSDADLDGRSGNDVS